MHAHARLFSRAQLFATPWTGLQSAWLLSPWNSLGKNTGVGYHFLLQGISPTQGLNLESLASPALTAMEEITASLPLGLYLNKSPSQGAVTQLTE